jgi:preprotein translocase subunit SecD
MSDASAETNRALEPLLIGLGQPGFTYGATYKAQGRGRTQAEIQVNIAGYYQGRIDHVTITTDNTSFTALSAEPYVQDPSLKALEDAKDDPHQALNAENISSHALQRWQDTTISTDEDSLISDYNELQEQRIAEIIEADLYEQLRTAIKDVEDVKAKQNERNNIVRTAINFDAVHARTLTSTAYNAMNVETHRMQDDKEYLADKGFTEVAAKAQRLKNTFNELRNRAHELYQYTGLAESMLAMDQPSHISRHGQRIGDRIEKESTERLKRHV